MTINSIESPARNSLDRFKVARPTLILDWFMDRFITVGGVMIIAAIAGIFVFILSQILPLFYPPSVTRQATVNVAVDSTAALLVDQWSELPMLVDRRGNISFVNLRGEPDRTARLYRGEDGALPVSFVRYSQLQNTLILGSNDGRVLLGTPRYEATFPAGRGRIVVPDISFTEPLALGDGQSGFRFVDYADAGPQKILAAIQYDQGQNDIHILTLRQRRTLLGAGALETDATIKLSAAFSGTPQNLIVTGDGDFIVVSTVEGVVHVFAREGREFNRRQTFYPFYNEKLREISSMDLLFGDVSLIFTSPEGKSVMYSVFHDRSRGERVFGQTKVFPDLPGPATFFSSSLRNKGFLIGGDGFVSLRYATTADVRWQKDIDFRVNKAVLGSRYDKIFLLDDTANLHVYDLVDRHPRAGWTSYFGKIHYEGRAKPEYIWQSTGGTDAFEPKLSMVPLIVGTMKGTIYAMLFALPIALLCALYTSQFLASPIRRTVKPVMEIMESVPTVVLGFLAALWLAPLISDRVPSFLLVCLGVPLSAVFAGWLAGKSPSSVRTKLKSGYEFVFYLPFLLASVWICWNAGPLLEDMLFVTVDPHSGVRSGDFRLWLTNEMGIPFEQRNALVVGFLMGFAVIPTIFTIAEDSMANVPSGFKSASLALGASRWQTALYVVVPTAAAGIFSAVMIGFGRAVGETMIVLMATGNTPVMNFNIFEGMRTLSANIAVELPEAPYGGTLYRSLFLGAMLLFLMTFVVNTAAELLRQYLREKYKSVE